MSRRVQEFLISDHAKRAIVASQWIMLVGFAVTLLWSLYVFRGLIYYQQGIGLQYQNNSQIASVVKYAEQAQNSEHGLLITGDPLYRGSFEAGLESMQLTVGILNTYLADAPLEEKAQLKELNSSLDRETKRMLAVIAVYDQQGFVAAQVMVKSNTGFNEMLHIRQVAGIIQAQEDARVNKVHARL